MRLGGRLAAAIEVLTDVETRHRPISEALKDWGHAHRFAGSGDRAAIGNLVYDVVRKKRSLAWLAGSDTPSACVFACIINDWDFSETKLREQLDGDKFAPELPDLNFFNAMAERKIDEAPEAVQANVPDWLQEVLEANFAEDWVEEAKSLSNRPPLDIRVNTIKADRDKVVKRLGRAKPKTTTIARNGLRFLAAKADRRHPNLTAEEGYQKGWFEIQDEGSQIVSDLVFAQKGESVLDYCAGAGGKTLALSASMENKGQVHAYDANKSRLAPIYDRIKRAGCRNVQVHAPEGESGVERLEPFIGKMDRVVIDAPCTGSGTWRRHPDTKWKLTPQMLETRIEEQAAVLEEAAPYVRIGGYLIYITCSILAGENENQIATFAGDNPEFEIVSLGEVWQDLFGFDKPQPWSFDMNSITLTPAATGTDGFFVAVLQKVE